MAKTKTEVLILMPGKRTVLADIDQGWKEFLEHIEGRANKDEGQRHGAKPSE